MDTQYGQGMYYYTRPIGLYIFSGVCSLSLIIQVGTIGKITGISTIVAILWGVLAWGFGNLLWAAVGDIITPYIHRDLYIKEEEGEVTVRETKLSVSHKEFNHHINKVINDHKLWARGMVELAEEEESELSEYLKHRWFMIIGDTRIPSYLSDSLLIKMHERGLIDGDSLTTYGETIIPNKLNLAEMAYTSIDYVT